MPATTVETRGYRRDRRGARPVRGVLWILLPSPLRRHGEKQKKHVLLFSSLCCAKVGTVPCGLGASECSVKAAEPLRILFVCTSRTEAPRVSIAGGDDGCEEAAALLPDFGL